MRCLERSFGEYDSLGVCPSDMPYLLWQAARSAKAFKVTKNTACVSRKGAATFTPTGCLLFPLIAKEARQVVNSIGQVEPSLRMQLSLCMCTKRTEKKDTPS